MTPPCTVYLDPDKWPAHIELTPIQLEAAALVAHWRRWKSRDLPNRYGLEGKSYDLDYWGAAGEEAAAAALGVFWPMSINTFKADDLPGYQVRTATGRDDCLIIRDGDDRNALYVLVICEDISHFTVYPPFWGMDAVRDEWWRAPNGRPGAWFVPQAALRQAQRMTGER